MRSKLVFIITLAMLLSVSLVNANHMANDYGRYDDQHLRYHDYGYHKYYYRSGYYRDYRYDHYDRNRYYYYRYHPLIDSPRIYYGGYDRYRNNINIRIVNSPDSIVRIN